MAKTPDAPTENPENVLDDTLPTGPGAAFTFIYYFSTAAFITALVAAKTFGVSLTTGLPGEIGLLGGAIGGTLGVVFNRSQTLEVPFTSKKQFRRQMHEAFTAMRYTLASREGCLSCYQKPKASRFFAGDIYVQERSSSMVFVSRAGNIRRLARLLPGESTET
jgi:hypothetical protein